MATDSQMACDPQVPWTNEQWARVNQVVQEEASRARVAATFLPLVGPLPGDTDFVRRERIGYPARPGAVLPPNNQLEIDDRTVIQLATLQVRVPVRGAQMADPEMPSVLALFRRAANVLARLEDAVIFRGLVQDPAFPAGQNRFRPPAGLAGIGVGPAQRIWEVTGGQALDGLWTNIAPPQQWIRVPPFPTAQRGEGLVRAVSAAIGALEANGHFGPFAVVLGQGLFLIAQTPDPGSLVLPQDRIIPFLGGGSLLRSSTLDALFGFSGIVAALGGAPVELAVATDVGIQFLQLSPEPVFIFRVYERMALRIKEPEAIIQLWM